MWRPSAERAREVGWSALAVLVDEQQCRRAALAYVWTLLRGCGCNLRVSPACRACLRVPGLGVTLVLLKTLHGISLLVSGVVGGLLRECAWHPGHLAVAWHSPGITRCCLGLWGIRGLGLDGLVLGCGGLRILHHRARELRTGHHSCRNLSSGKTAGLGLACALHLAGHHAVRHLPWVRSGSVGLLRISGLSRVGSSLIRPRAPGIRWALHGFRLVRAAAAYGRST